MNDIVTGLGRVNVINDDILVYGRTVQGHNERLKAVLERARQVNLKLNLQKSKIWLICRVYFHHGKLLIN